MIGDKNGKDLEVNGGWGGGVRSSPYDVLTIAQRRNREKNRRKELRRQARDREAKEAIRRASEIIDSDDDSD